ncbi:MAG: GNAT family N-acetyltransferase, partial [Parvularculaceae bacterium]|nr:GNAT family N-acetyltransferase [Parvularculaceae bacterium]
MIRIRAARADERGALEALQRRASLANEGDRAALLAHPDAIQLPQEQIAAGAVHVAEDAAGVVLGFAAVLPRGDKDAELDGLFVDPPAQRRGVGRALVARSVEIARAAGARALYVVGNPHAEVFYRACGFAVIGRAETEFGPGLSMRLDLAPTVGDWLRKAS